MKQAAILIVDDNPEIREIIQILLTGEGFQVHEAANGTQALSQLKENIFDLIILDIMMPKRDGIDVLCQLRRQGNRLPVLLLTAKSEVDDKVLGLDSGANDYLTKPFASQELLARIRAMTREQTVQATSRLQVGNITVVRGTFELSSPAGRLRLAI